MNKTELIEAVRADKDAQIETKAAAERAVKAVLDAMQTGLRKDGEVQIIGFGSFYIKKRAARDGRNPQTGEKIRIKASKTVGFRPGTKFNEVARKARPKKKK